MSRVGEAIAPSDRADLARAAEAIAARQIGLGAPLTLVAETGSTNDDAKQGAREGAPHGAVWAAEAQRAGRGRQGRAWRSSPGDDVLFSVLLRLRCAPLRVPPLSLVCGLAVRDAVAAALGAPSDDDVLVKWPNDVLVRSAADGALRKVAGILVESAVLGDSVDYVIVGVGINVRATALPDELSELATSLALERRALERRALERRALERRARAGAAVRLEAGPLDRAEILADVLAGLDRDVARVAQDGLGVVHDRLVRHDALAGRAVESRDEARPLRGTACGIDAEGRLLVRDAAGVVNRLSSGEMRMATVREGLLRSPP